MKSESQRPVQLSMRGFISDLEQGIEAKVVNVSKVLHRSPFRYPGGKTWLVPHVRMWLRSLTAKPKLLIEPFAGGAIVGLSALFDNMVDEIVLVELDEDVAAVWKTVLGPKGNQLVKEIAQFTMTEDSVRSLLSAKHNSIFDRAFATLVRNRVQRGGILAPGASLMKNGENGKGLTSRWYPETLRRRILDIRAFRKKIAFIQGNGLEVIAEHCINPGAAYFIDPPYTVAGRRLYKYSTIEHDQLFYQVSNVQGQFLMSYDDAGSVRLLANNHDFETRSVCMKNTHHTVMQELLISRDLSWLGKAA
jgi:DNA adenine methylase